MKYFYHMIVALCLFVAVQKGNSQNSAFDFVETYGVRASNIGEEAIIIDLKVPVSAFDVVGLNVDQKSNGHLIRIHCTKELPDFESWLKPVGGDTWLYITLADAKADVAVLQDFEPTAFIKKILIFQSATSVQLTFRLKGKVKSVELIPVAGSRDILVAIFTPDDEQIAIQRAR